MLKRTLGRCGIEVSALGLGCWAIGGPWTFEGHQAGWGDVDDQASLQAIAYALDQGIDFFDTAANYGCGHSERILGRALAGRRDEVVIATKFGYRVDEAEKNVTHYGYPRRGEIASHIRDDCEASLRRLDTDLIDLYVFHVGYYLPEHVDPILDVLEGLVAAGKIRYYGWSTDNPEGARAFAKGDHCIAIQHNLTVMTDAPAMIELCETEHLASVNRSPLGRGLLTGKYSATSTFADNDIRSRDDFAQRWASPMLTNLDVVRDALKGRGRTLTQGALCWIWGRSGCTIPIPGFRNVAHLAENIAALDHGPMSEDEVQQIDALLSREVVR
jgi:aryl-alcohol dehydrogenase-like predicted oxidoreductase